jgi:uncharacterized membrane protein YwzB
MNINDAIRIIVYLISFGFSLYVLSGLNFNQWFRPGKSYLAQPLLLMLSLALAYLVAEFVLGLSVI